MFKNKFKLLSIILLAVLVIGAFASIGATWVQSVGLLSNTAVVITTDASVTDKFMANIGKAFYNDKIQIATSATDGDDKIQAALAYVSGTGVHGTVAILGATLTGNAQIDAVSNVDVVGNGATIVIASTGATTNGVLFTSTTNTHWSNFIIKRTGAVASLAFAVVNFTGTTDGTTVVEYVTAYNDCTSLASGGAAWGTSGTAHPTINYCNGYSAPTPHSQAFAISGGFTYQSYPTVTNSYMESRGTGSGDNNGFDVEGTDGITEGTALTQPRLINCTGKGSSGNVHGYGISFKWGSAAYGNGLLGISAGGNLSAGICFEGQTTAFVENSVGRGVGLDEYVYGVAHIKGSMATAVNVSGEIDAFDKGGALYIDGYSHPNIQGGDYGFVKHAKTFLYDDANNGRFRPFATDAYQLISLSVYVAVAHVGETIDIGTSVGGNEVYNNLSIAGINFLNPAIVQVEVAGNGYLYITPSVAITDGDVEIYYAVEKNLANTYGLYVPVAGSYTGWYEIDGATFTSTNDAYPFAVPSNNGNITHCTFKAITLKAYPDISIYPINFYQCVFYSIDLSAGYPTLPVNHGNRFIGYLLRNSGTATVLNTATTIVVAHGLSGTPSRIMITPKENPTNAVTFWWVDTVGAANFTINVNADPGATNLDFDWTAWVGEGN